MRNAKCGGQWPEAVRPELFAETLRLRVYRFAIGGRADVSGISRTLSSITRTSVKDQADLFVQDHPDTNTGES